MEDDYVDLGPEESQCAEAMSPFILHLMKEDEMIPALSMAFLTIAETYTAYDNQFKRIMNIIQHSLVDYKDKPYK